MRCSFCRKDIPEGTGRLYVQSDGKILRFCSSKCKKNMLKLKRNPRKIKWARRK